MITVGILSSTARRFNAMPEARIAQGGDRLTVFSRIFGEDELSSSPAKALNQVFRLFNRVDETDRDRLDTWSYELPSLSVGDFVLLRYGNLSWEVHQVKGVGFDFLGFVGIPSWECVEELLNDEQRETMERGF